jgi:hypothetical protein
MRPNLSRRCARGPFESETQRASKDRGQAIAKTQGLPDACGHRSRERHLGPGWLVLWCRSARSAGARSKPPAAPALLLGLPRAGLVPQLGLNRSSLPEPAPAGDQCRAPAQRALRPHRDNSLPPPSSPRIPGVGDRGPSRRSGTSRIAGGDEMEVLRLARRRGDSVGREPPTDGLAGAGRRYAAAPAPACVAAAPPPPALLAATAALLAEAVLRTRLGEAGAPRSARRRPRYAEDARATPKMPALWAARPRS